VAASTLVGAAPARGRIRWRKHLVGYAFLAPWLLGFLVFVAGPMLASAVLAFSDYNVITPPRWVGLANFEALADDKRFYLSLYNTAYYTFLGVPAQLAVAMALALLLNARVRFTSFFRSAFYIPTITPVVASIYLWVWMFNFDYGLINAGLRLIGLAPVNWLWDPGVAKISIIIFSLTRVGAQMVIFLAALQGVPEELYESAAIDGASALRKFWHVTVPMISPLVFLNLVLGIISSFQVFTVAYIATKGGPVDSTLFYVLYLYHHGFQNFKMGFASAMAWILFAVIVLFTLAQFRASRSWVYYESGGGTAAPR
jgi:multiple sugar transport system permease protein